MPLVVRRPITFMCTICGGLFDKAEDAAKCESKGIFLPHCGEGDIIDHNYDHDTKRDFLNKIVGHDDSYFYDRRYKVVGVRLEMIGRGYPYGNRPSHGSFPMMLLCKMKDGTDTNTYSRIIAPDVVPPKKVADWREYFEELKKRNPSLENCDNYRKYGNSQHVFDVLYALVHQAVKRIPSI